MTVMKVERDVAAPAEKVWAIFEGSTRKALMAGLDDIAAAAEAD